MGGKGRALKHENPRHADNLQFNGDTKIKNIET